MSRPGEVRGGEAADKWRWPSRQPIHTASESRERPNETDPDLFAPRDDLYPQEIPADAPDANRLPSPVFPPGGSPRELEVFSAGTDGLYSAPFAAGDPLSSIPVDAFYTCFFPAHPFVLPRAQLTSQCDADPGSVSHLIPIMALIGALYAHDSKQAQGRRQDAERMLGEALPPTGFTVQTLMLLALCLEWTGEGQRAGDTLQRAKDVALEIGMDRRSYAVEFGGGIPVVEESWRRTWWELYVVDSFFAGIRHWPTFSLWKLGADVRLPADEEHYLSGVRVSKPLQMWS